MSGSIRLLSLLEVDGRSAPRGGRASINAHLGDVGPSPASDID